MRKRATLPPPQSTLDKADTVALWYAVDWMATVLAEWGRDGFKDDTDRAQHADQRATLLRAKRALRKVNAIRKAQACRPTANLQEQPKPAGGLP